MHCTALQSSEVVPHSALLFIAMHCISVYDECSFPHCGAAGGALVGSGYGTPYGGQDMAGGEKQCSRSRRSSSRRSRRKREDGTGHTNVSDLLLPHRMGVHC